MAKKKIKVRKVWVINPKTRIKPSSKIYSRPKQKQLVTKIVKKGNYEN